MDTDDPETELRIELTSSYYYNRLDRLVRQLEPLLTLKDPRRIVVDLAGLAGVGPAALALLTAGLVRAEQDGFILEDSVLIPPKNQQVRNYLLRMDLLRHLVAGEDVEEPFSRRPSDGFRPCQHFTEEDECPKVARTLTDALGERCELDGVANMSMYFCLSELADNVVHHADTRHGGFAAAQHWKSKGLFEIAMADLGVGVRASLTKNSDYAHISDDMTAVRKAIEPQVTSTPERNSGIGLFVTSMLLAANGGEMLLWSGTASALRGSRNQESARSSALPGTLVVVRVRTDRALDIQAVYRQFKDLLPDDDH